MTQSTEERLDRLESTLAIQQLPARYALAVDSRDVDTWISLFIEDVDCGRYGRGREALRSFIDPGIRSRATADAAARAISTAARRAATAKASTSLASTM